MDTQTGKSKVWIVEIEKTEGQGLKAKGVGQTENDVEGQGGRFTKLGESDEDTEGQGVRFHGLRQTEDGRYLVTVDTDDDLTGQGYRPASSVRPKRTSRARAAGTTGS